MIFRRGSVRRPRTTLQSRVLRPKGAGSGYRAVEDRLWFVHGVLVAADAGDSVDVLFVEGFVREEGICEPVETVTVLPQRLEGAAVASVDDAPGLRLQQVAGGFGQRIRAAGQDDLFLAW